MPIGRKIYLKESLCLVNSLQGAKVLRKRITVKGIVQGIGLRPYVYNLAISLGICGFISNSTKGVLIEIEGEEEKLESFLISLCNNNLPLFYISQIEEKKLPFLGTSGFEIRKSNENYKKGALVLPDLGICRDCLQELKDPQNRRFLYPFITCTNCGPRYTIIKDIPYDRKRTSMREFVMCSVCEAEYRNHLNRRFHCQSNSCWDCGPRLSLCDNRGNLIEEKEPTKLAQELLKEGFILAIKGIGGFHIAVDATNTEAVLKLRERKKRDEKSLALMWQRLEKIKECCYVGREDEAILTSREAPIVLLRKKEINPISRYISENNYFGGLLAYTPLHWLLLSDLLAAVMTSGNLSDEPITIDNKNSLNTVGSICDYFLISNRDIYFRADDSIVQNISGNTRITRRSRGYAPKPIILNRKFPQILGVGGELKSTFCLTNDNFAFLSPHIGDLKDIRTFTVFQETLEHFKRLFDIKPEIIAYDLHPDYISTRFALEQAGEKIGVQHHHSHIVSCMVENNLEGEVIGLVFDGVGYGIDGTMWGGEVMLVETNKFKRLAHLEYIPMPGGDMATREPWRMGISYLYQTFKDDMWELNLPIFKRIDKEKIKIITEVIKKDINSPKTSSLGRLFDGVAAILGINFYSSYEGQAAILLETMASGQNENEMYSIEIKKEDGVYIISPTPIICGIISDMEKGKEIAAISLKFHWTLVNLFTDLCLTLKKEIKQNRVVLSGGCFQNAILLSGLLKELKQRGMSCSSHSKVPTNDGGISLGQVRIAGEVLKCV